MTEFTKRFRQCTFENYKCDTSLQTKLVEYLENSVKVGFKDNVIITGGVGLGKTHLAYSIVNALESVREIPATGSGYYTSQKVELTTIKAVIDGIRACWRSDDRADYDFINKIKTISLLIIDEVGVQYGTESERLELFDIFNYRYNQMLPTIIISNCNKPQMSKILGQRIIDRLFSGAKVYELYGESKR